MHILVRVCRFSFSFNFLQTEYNQSLKVAQVDRRNAGYKYGLPTKIFIINKGFYSGLSCP